MRIHLLQATRRTPCRSNKDTNGGYGTINEFGTGPTSRLLTAAKKRAMNFPELGPGYAAAILKGQGHEVSYAENRANPDAEVTLMQSSLVHFNEERRQAKALKSEHPHMRVGFFGGVCDTLFDELLEVADFVVNGEIEAALLGGDIADFDGRVLAGFAPDLDALPFPDWSHVDEATPYGLVTRGRQRRLAPMLASRGCPMPCRYYCTYPLAQGIRQRTRSIGNIVAEMKHLKARHGTNLVLFRDPIFTLDMARTKALCRAMIEANLGIEYVIETHARFTDDEMIELLAGSGCIAVQFGIEGGNTEVMARSKRKGDLDAQETVVRAFERRGIRVLGLFMLGYFDDTEDTIEQTIDYAIRLNPYGAQFTVATPYPGTPWYAKLASENERYRLSEDYDDYTQYRLVYAHPHLGAADVERLKNRAYRRFYCRPGYALKHHLPGRGAPSASSRRAA